MPGTCGWVILHRKRDIADVAEVNDFEMGILAWIIQVGPN